MMVPYAKLIRPRMCWAAEPHALDREDVDFPDLDQ
jgi:hypothetical protein